MTAEVLDLSSPKGRGSKPKRLNMPTQVGFVKPDELLSEDEMRRL